MSIFDRLKSGEIIPFSDPDYYQVSEACAVTRKFLVQANNTHDLQEIRSCLNAIFDGTLPESATVFTPFYTNYGKNIRIGQNVFINHACSILDLGGVTIEDGVMVAPRVNIISEEHPIAPADRQKIFCKPVHIKRKAWIGAGVTILAGVTIGENSVVAAGAVVTKDVPDNTVVGGIPARIIKNL